MVDQCYLHIKGHKLMLEGHTGCWLQPFLMKPLSNRQPDAAEARYAQAHVRNGVATTKRLWKLRFCFLLKKTVAINESKLVSKMVLVQSISHKICFTSSLIGGAAKVSLKSAHYFGLPKVAQKKLLKTGLCLQCEAASTFDNKLDVGEDDDLDESLAVPLSKAAEVT